MMESINWSRDIIRRIAICVVLLTSLYGITESQVEVCFQQNDMGMMGENCTCTSTPPVLPERPLFCDKCFVGDLPDYLMSKNGNCETNATVLCSTICTFECAEGYTLSHNKTIQCIGGEFSPHIPWCNVSTTTASTTESITTTALTTTQAESTTTATSTSNSTPITTMTIADDITTSQETATTEAFQTTTESDANTSDRTYTTERELTTAQSSTVSPTSETILTTTATTSGGISTTGIDITTAPSPTIFTTSEQSTTTVAEAVTITAQTSTESVATTSGGIRTTEIDATTALSPNIFTTSEPPTTVTAAQTSTESDGTMSGGIVTTDIQITTTPSLPSHITSESSMATTVDESTTIILQTSSESVASTSGEPGTTDEAIATTLETVSAPSVPQSTITTDGLTTIQSEPMTVPTTTTTISSPTISTPITATSTPITATSTPITATSTPITATSTPFTATTSAPTSQSETMSTSSSNSPSSPTETMSTDTSILPSTTGTTTASTSQSETMSTSSSSPTSSSPSSPTGTMSSTTTLATTDTSILTYTTGTTTTASTSQSETMSTSSSSPTSSSPSSPTETNCTVPNNATVKSGEGCQPGDTVASGANCTFVCKNNKGNITWSCTAGGSWHQPVPNCANLHGNIVVRPTMSTTSTTLVDDNATGRKRRDVLPSNNAAVTLVQETFELTIQGLDTTYLANVTTVSAQNFTNDVLQMNLLFGIMYTSAISVDELIIHVEEALQAVDEFTVISVDVSDLDTLCSPNPCENNAGCTVDYNNLNFTCSCAVGYSGRLCSDSSSVLLIAILVPTVTLIVAFTVFTIVLVVYYRVRLHQLKGYKKRPSDHNMIYPDDLQQLYFTEDKTPGYHDQGTLKNSTLGLRFSKEINAHMQERSRSIELQAPQPPAYYIGPADRHPRQTDHVRNGHSLSNGDQALQTFHPNGIHNRDKASPRHMVDSSSVEYNYAVNTNQSKTRRHSSRDNHINRTTSTSQSVSYNRRWTRDDLDGRNRAHLERTRNGGISRSMHVEAEFNDTRL
ncbi:mucin-3A-like isoform X1 [Lytechinus pictus]|uniref:mucin-3A-like isoform X1 n=1 Tax=Lytechinus pictus TaxID=7653 RepID=UPI0030BA172F